MSNFTLNLHNEKSRGDGTDVLKHREFQCPRSCYFPEIQNDVLGESLVYEVKEPFPRLPLYVGF